MKPIYIYCTVNLTEGSIEDIGNQSKEESDAVTEARNKAWSLVFTNILKTPPYRTMLLEDAVDEIKADIHEFYSKY